MVYIVLAILPAALLMAAADDAYEFIIPNWISLVLLGAFPLAVFCAGGSLSLVWQGYLIGFPVLLVGFALFAFGYTGGGDVKLLAAAAPWFGLAASADFLLWTGIAGGGLALAILSFRELPIFPIYARFSWLLELHNSEKGIPYGVAICVGGLMAFPETQLFKLVFGT